MNNSKYDALFPPLPKNVRIDFFQRRPYFIRIFLEYLNPKLNYSLIAHIKKIVPKNNIYLLDGGTSSLYIALKNLSLTETDEVIIPSFTCKAVIRAVISSGAKPIFADVDKNFNLDYNKIKSVLTKNTKAIIAVHQYGKACDIDKIQSFCKKNNLVLIEDSAIPVGIKHKQKYVGSYGNHSIFSFNAGKTVVAFGGGFIATNELISFEPTKKGKNHILYFITSIYYKRIFSIFYNLLRNLRLVQREENIEKLYQKNNAKYLVEKYLITPKKMTRFQRAAALYQLKNIDDITTVQRNIAKIYKDELKGINEIILPKGENHQFTYFPILTKNRYQLSKFLSEKGIETQWTFYPLHLQEPFKKYVKKDKLKKNKLTMTDHLWKQELSLPIGPDMVEKDARFVCVKIKEFYKNDQKNK